MKKGQGLSITTIVVAAIALLVLVVLVAIFTGQIGDTAKTMKSCTTLKGECRDSELDCDILKGETVYTGRNSCQNEKNSEGKEKVCCIPLISGDKKDTTETENNVDIKKPEGTD